MKKPTSLIISLCMLVGVVLSNVLPEPCEQGGNCVTTTTTQVPPTRTVSPTSTPQATTTESPQTDDTEPVNDLDDTKNNQQTNKTDDVPKNGRFTPDESDTSPVFGVPVWALLLCAGTASAIFLVYMSYSFPSNFWANFASRAVYLKLINIIMFFVWTVFCRKCKVKIQIK